MGRDLVFLLSILAVTACGALEGLRGQPLAAFRTFAVAQLLVWAW